MNEKLSNLDRFTSLTRNFLRGKLEILCGSRQNQSSALILDVGWKRFSS